MKIRFAPRPTFLGEQPDVNKWQEGTVVNGGVQLVDGLYLSVQPDGSYQTRSAVDGPYEQIAPAVGLNVLKVTPRVATFVIPYIEQ